ncbi:MAG: GNAT family N-acetyltransferase [Roseburia sp.]|nr:GNAT family N-acetyltransferase [Roseburia sp.]MCM1099706.1 GNAT family N-acetyltransferase [Ruminococcus flavefaciens]
MAAQGYGLWGYCNQYLYTAREPLPVKFPEIRRLESEDAPYVLDHYVDQPEDCIRERIRDGMMYGAFAEGRQIGFIGIHKEGSMGMLFVEEAFRRQGVGEALEAYCVNRHLERGWIPYGHTMEGNLASERLQEKLGFYKASQKICWMAGRRGAE